MKKNLLKWAALAACVFPMMTSCIISNDPKNPQEEEQKEPTSLEIVDDFINGADSLKVSVEVKHLVGVWRLDYSTYMPQSAKGLDIHAVNITDYTSEDRMSDRIEYYELKSDMKFYHCSYYTKKIEGEDRPVMEEESGEWSLVNSTRLILNFGEGRDPYEYIVHSLEADRMVWAKPYKTQGGEDYVTYDCYTRIEALPKKPANPTANIAKFDWVLESDSVVVWKWKSSIDMGGTITGDYVRESKQINQLPAKCVFSVDDRHQFLFVKSAQGEDILVAGLDEDEYAEPDYLYFLVSPAKDEMEWKWEYLSFKPSWKDLSKAVFYFQKYVYEGSQNYKYEYYCHVTAK